MINDILADACTRLRNALKQGKLSTEVMKSKLVLEVLKKMKDEGYVGDIEVKERVISVGLRYYNKQPAIKHIKKISKNSNRKYIGKNNPMKPTYEYGTIILSTNKGIKTLVEAKKENIGGESMVEIF